MKKDDLKRKFGIIKEDEPAQNSNAMWDTIQAVVFMICVTVVLSTCFHAAAQQ